MSYSPKPKRPSPSARTADLALAFCCFAAALLLLLRAGLPHPITDARPTRRVTLESFRFETLDGAAFTLESDAERLTVLNFWSSWCRPCRAEMAELDALHRSHGASIRVIGINHDESRGAANALAAELSVKYPLLLDPHLDAAREFGLRQLPMTALLDLETRVIRVYYGAISTQGLLRDIAALESED